MNDEKITYLQVSLNPYSFALLIPFAQTIINYLWFPKSITFYLSPKILIINVAVNCYPLSQFIYLLELQE